MRIAVSVQQGCRPRYIVQAGVGQDKPLRLRVRGTRHLGQGLCRHFTCANLNISLRNPLAKHHQHELVTRLVDWRFTPVTPSKSFYTQIYLLRAVGRLLCYTKAPDARLSQLRGPLSSLRVGHVKALTALPDSNRRIRRAPNCCALAHLDTTWRESKSSKSTARQVEVPSAYNVMPLQLSTNLTPVVHCSMGTS
jgi:hypothetical protein